MTVAMVAEEKRGLGRHLFSSVVLNLRVKNVSGAVHCKKTNTAKKEEQQQESSSFFLLFFFFFCN